MKLASLRVWAVACALFGALPLARTAPAQPTDEIYIVEAQGVVQIWPAGANRWIRTGTNESLTAGDRLRTGRNSRVGLRWSDQSVATFGAETEMEVVPPHRPDARFGVNLIKGLLSFFHRDKPNRIQVITRGAIAGVDGTEFMVNVEPIGDTEETTLFVIDGIVRLGNEQDTLVLTNGQAAAARPGQAPVLIAGFVANNIIQWALYYPAILDPSELPLTKDEASALAKSLGAYQQGDLLAALREYPEDRKPASDAERIYHAALVINVGQIDQAAAELKEVRGEEVAPLAEALRQMIAAVKHEEFSPGHSPALASELLAASYYEQSRATADVSLRSALRLARQAVAKSPEFGFAWARVAELEFSFGRVKAARAAVEKALALTPRNAQAIALQGFLHLAENRPREAVKWFDKAISADSALANAWLGRGLARIRTRQAKAGEEDLLIAAALEPQRSLLRSYLGKAHREPAAAERELGLAVKLDPNDPTPWLYSALIKAENNRINEAIRDLERSKELNDNRLLYRSRLLLDQDRGIRSANLARIYADAGLEEVALREAGKSVAADYGNYSAHHFLANSYDELRRANPFDLRFETAAFNEYLLGNIMGPSDGRMLARSVSQQDHTRLFQRDHVGFSSMTEYLSRGAWRELAVQYGTFGNSSYALEGDYSWDPGQSKNTSIEQKSVSARFKHMVTPNDGVFAEILYFSQDAEHIGAKYDPDATVPGVRTREKQEPVLLAGFDHQWNEANRTLFLASHLNDSLQHVNPKGGTYLLPEFLGSPDFDLVRVDLTQEYRNRFTIDSFELQHLNRLGRFQTIAGIRFQDSLHRVSNEQIKKSPNATAWDIFFGPPGTIITNQSLRLDALRISPYVYEHWEIVDSLWLIGGLSYDYQEQPRNLTFAPVSDQQEITRQLSPKAAFVWTPTARSAVRAAYTRSLGGVSLDQSVRLEPSQLAGFVQSYREVIPASVAGTIDASRIQTTDISLEHRLRTHTYFGVGAQLLRSDVEHDVGVFQRDALTSTGPGIQIEEKLRYRERSFNASVHQLLDDWFSVGVTYRLSEARLKRSFPELASLAGDNNHTIRGLLHTIGFQTVFRHPSGFFASAEALWWSQELSGSPGLEEDPVGQGNLFVGYRSPRRYVEIVVGVLNVADEDYRIHPINLYAELPRERTLFTRVQLNF